MLSTAFASPSQSLISMFLTKQKASWLGNNSTKSHPTGDPSQLASQLLQLTELLEVCNSRCWACVKQMVSPQHRTHSLWASRQLESAAGPKKFKASIASTAWQTNTAQSWDLDRHFNCCNCRPQSWKVNDVNWDSRHNPLKSGLYHEAHLSKSKKCWTTSFTSQVHDSFCCDFSQNVQYLICFIASIPWQEPADEKTSQAAESASKELPCDFLQPSISKASAWTVFGYLWRRHPHLPNDPGIVRSRHLV